MKRLFRKIAEFFGFVKKTKPSLTVSFDTKTNCNEVDQNNFFGKERPPYIDLMPKKEEPIDDGVPTQDIADNEMCIALWEVEEDLTFTPLNDCALNSPITFKKPKPTDAIEKQNLTKYNNPETVYRNSKGRFAKLN